MRNAVVIDTETVTGTYGLLSVGAVVIEMDGERICPLDTFFGFSDEFDYGFFFAQQQTYTKRNNIKRKARLDIEKELFDMLCRYKINTAFAYNARFDKTVVQTYLPSLKLNWLDLMAPARQVLADAAHYPAYKKLYPYCELTRNGLLKRGYSVECVGRYLGLGQETHVAIEDALMEIEIAVRLGLFSRAAAC